MRDKNKVHHASVTPKSDIKYRNTLIRTLFQDRKRAIELCNAVTGSNYPEDTNVQICDLDSSLVWRYNDLAFAIDHQLLFMIEHQSTISPNLPLRFLSYLTDTIYSWFVKVDQLYGKKLYQIPAPKCYVLYNGTEPLKEKMLKLSDAFYINDEKVSLELIVEIIDVNHATRHDVLQKSESLAGYSYLIDQIRMNMQQGLTQDKAISVAIDSCIKQGVLSEFLQKHYAEVAKMINLQYNQEAEFEIIRQEAKEEGIGEGIERGLERGIERGIEKGAMEVAKKALLKGISIDDISEITGLDVETIAMIKSEM